MSGPTVEDFVCVETATDPHFWADGSEVVFRWNRPGVPQVFTVEAVGGLPRQLTDSGESPMDWPFDPSTPRYS